jgi:hypothetical protein
MGPCTDVNITRDTTITPHTGISHAEVKKGYMLLHSMVRIWRIEFDTENKFFTRRSFNFFVVPAVQFVLKKYSSFDPQKAGIIPSLYLST